MLLYTVPCISFGVNGRTEVQDEMVAMVVVCAMYVPRSGFSLRLWDSPAKCVLTLGHAFPLALNALCNIMIYIITWTDPFDPTPTQLSGKHTTWLQPSALKLKETR